MTGVGEVCGSGYSKAQGPLSSGAGLGDFVHGQALLDAVGFKV